MDIFNSIRNHNHSDCDTVYCVGAGFINVLKKDDSIVLLPAWFAKSWAKNVIKEIKVLFPTITFEYLDGKIGENERKNNLQSETISNRFDILDL